MESFILCFIPLLVAIDPLASVPLFLSLTEGLTIQQKRRLALQAVATAFIAGTLFGVMGPMVFSVLGITSADFRIAGGLLLVILSIRDIAGITAKTQGAVPDNYIGTVPLGIPLIAGPAMFTTLLILNDEHRFLIILVALMVNMVIALILLACSELIANAIGQATIKAIAKITAIFLAAIGVMMIRKGWETLWR